MKKFLLALCVLSVPCSSVAGWFGPDNYEDCILENSKGVDSDVAARLVHNACRKKFPTDEEIRMKKICDDMKTLSFEEAKKRYPDVGFFDCTQMITD
ncbi:hypothetical protein [Desulforhopalus sp. IMCC35007]|uniref:hypothetical protein n=1 Tax=Desulforhopalus sp. IMCC35007 TaxID=2569543 RepID=UPI0010ADD0C7|nr:hypothetical protein [Desulforhopalus sp. IMCC35007]TKB08404.1 hypothetical protein FCL48_13800 [Desulforhopalus sp. IMCC35007]